MKTMLNAVGFASVALLTSLWVHGGSAAEPVQASPAKNAEFWQGSIGWWSSNNTYLDSKLQQDVAAYNSIVHIEMQGERVIETSYKFYPPGDSSGYYSKGQVSTDKGIELVSIMVMEDVDNSGSLQTVSVSPVNANQPGRMTTTALSPTTALQRKIEPTSQLPYYHTLITMPAPDRRYTAMYGIRTGFESDDVEAGDLRALALYAGRRISKSDVAGLRARYRELNAVAAVVSGNAAGETVVEVLH